MNLLTTASLLTLAKSIYYLVWEHRKTDNAHMLDMWRMVVLSLLRDNCFNFRVNLVFPLNFCYLPFTTLTKLTMPETRTKKAARTQGADSAGSELVTVATLRELFKVQERMFKNLFDSLLANVNARLDSVIGKVAEIKARLDIYEKDTSYLRVSLEFSKKGTKDLKP